MEQKIKTDSQLKRELNLLDAVGIGLGAIVGAGIFVVSGVAAGMAGPAMLISLLIAGLAAACNGLSSAQLAARFPKAGGTYEYGYELIHPLAGFSAGWMFLASKLAAGGVVALGLGSYWVRFFPGMDQRWIATVAALLLVIANLAGIKKAGLLNRLIVSITLLALLYFILAGTSKIDPTNFAPFAPQGFSGVARATGVLFFAFTGYARIATLGEEVRNPQKTIPRAIVITLIISFVLYSLIVFVALGTVGATEIARGESPIFAAAEVIGNDYPALLNIIGVAAITAMLGVLLSQILGTSRVFFAMGRRGDMPHFFSKVSPNAVPIYGVLASGAVVLLTIWLGELVAVTQAASFTILIYYGIANFAALRLANEERFLPRWISALGLLLCILMAASLALQIIIAGIILLIIGLVLRIILHRIYN